MISFFIAIAFLVAGYFIYGLIVDRNFGPDNRKTPAFAKQDGTDYIPMPTWKVFLIQLLNIAGTGPIFGALNGAIFGPVVYIWIILGCIFAGGVHDYMTGMMAIRHDGLSIPEITGIYLGNNMKQVIRVFAVILLVMCGVVFTTGPAGLLDQLSDGLISTDIWIWIILGYFFLATFLPIDKIIGKIYPVFGGFMILMAILITWSLVFSGKFQMPEVWNNFTNMHPNDLPIWPFMCITVACGAISGFHATQTPIVTRCCKSEHLGHKIFYGTMVCEGIIALVWAAAGVSCYDSTQELLAAGGGCSAVVYQICQTSLGKIGCVIAVLGVVICPISSGDTAFRSARLVLADWFKVDQHNPGKRLLLTLPLLIAGAIICRIDYSVVWRYFSWSNQTLACIVLWTATAYLFQHKKSFAYTVIPATFMTALSSTYFLCAPECLGKLWQAFNVPFQEYYYVSIVAGILVAICILLIFRHWERNRATQNQI